MVFPQPMSPVRTEIACFSMEYLRRAIASWKLVRGKQFADGDVALEVIAVKAEVSKVHFYSPPTRCCKTCPL